MEIMLILTSSRVFVKSAKKIMVIKALSQTKTSQMSVTWLFPGHKPGGAKKAKLKGPGTYPSSPVVYATSGSYLFPWAFGWDWDTHIPFQFHHFLIYWHVHLPGTRLLPFLCTPARKFFSLHSAFYSTHFFFSQIPSPQGSHPGVGKFIVFHMNSQAKDLMGIISNHLLYW